MLLLAGLGNVGPEYARHRHNVGFMAIDRIHAKYGFGPFRRRFQSMTADGELAAIKTLLVKPTTYMNESGRAIGEAVQFFKLAPENVVVIHDEIALASGKLRVKKGGGTAGNKGIKSIDEHIGPDFRRVRIGIGHPGEKSQVASYVLHEFAKADQDWLDPLLDAIAEYAPLLAAGRDDQFMNKISLAFENGL
jgi:PTH1 family peptidyl-tRNA hydrolase